MIKKKLVDDGMGKDSYSWTRLTTEELAQAMKHLDNKDVFLEYSGNVKFSHHYTYFLFYVKDVHLVIYDPNTHCEWLPIEDFSINLITIHAIKKDCYGDIIFELNKFNDYIKIGLSHRSDYLEEYELININ